MHDRPLLVKFVEDLGKYCLRGRTKFSEKNLLVFLLLYSRLARQQPGHSHWTFVELVTLRFDYLVKGLLLSTLQASAIITNPANTRAHLRLQ